MSDRETRTHQRLDSDISDPFELYQHPRREVFMWRWVAGACAGALLVSGFVVFALALRPLPVVVVDSGLKAEPVLFETASRPSLKHSDVLSFFAHATSLRHGWHSDNVETKLLKYLELSHASHRAQVVAYLANPAASESRGPSVSRMRFWEGQQATHFVSELQGDQEISGCQPLPENGMWRCQYPALLVEHSYTDEGHGLKANDFLFTGVVAQAPRTAKNPWGFLLLDMVAQVLDEPLQVEFL